MALKRGIATAAEAVVEEIKKGVALLDLRFSGYEGASRVRKPLRLFFLPNDFQPAARAGPG